MKRELRIGNYIESNLTYTHKKINSRFTYVVDEIKTFNVLVHDFRQPLKTTHLRFEDILPISLTEEWLLKFGILNWFLDNRFEIRKNETYYSVYAWKSGVAIFICDLKYVHHLQNFHFAIQGEELTETPRSE